MKKIFISTLTLALLSVTSCKTDFDQDVQDIAVTNGDADFSKYISLGNSLTAGYRDGALYIDGQNESYPSMIAGQMKLAGGGDFIQPMMADNNGGLLLNGNPILGTKLYIESFANGAPVLKNVAAAPTTDIANKITGPLNNFGVPGAKSYHLVASGYGNIAGVPIGAANPYYVRFSSSATSTVIGDAADQQPTFFSLWIGNNDVLGYATSGGSGINQTGNFDPTTYGSNDISDPNVVAGSIKGMLDILTANNAKGVIANIPDVTSIPFFTTVPYNAIPMDDATAQALNTGIYGPLKAALTFFGQGDRINLVSAGNNPVLIVDNELTDLSAQLTAALMQNGYPQDQATFIGNAFGQARQAEEGELILLTASGILGLDAITNQPPTPTSQFIYGASFPIGDQYSLTSDEVDNIATAVASYNSAIAGLAVEYELAFVDANKKMVELGGQSGIQWSGVTYTASFITGGTFSLDGVHLTGRGYAIIANEFIKAINKTYRSNLPQVNPNAYSGVTFP
ncbi:MAG: G-D-S-L family lipolytic protein [Flavobacteriaceae bacterium]|jgi:lysophospholipase L1-like esterase|nr:G-D-S-L family lipolytic protein [Flavobacteriaceae bacterium]